MKILLDIPKEMQERAARAARKAGADIHDFIMTAIANQITAELGDTNPWESEDDSRGLVSEKSSVTGKPETKSSASVANSLLVKPSFAPLLIDNGVGRVEKGLIWGQYYKFFPVKAGIRVLANISSDKLPSYLEFREIASEISADLRKKIEKIDKSLGKKHGDKLSSGLPESDVKSKRRYASQCLIYYKSSSGTLDGLAAKMGWINVTIQDGSMKVGLTNSGYKFALLDNPALDRGEGKPLSEEEVSFIVDSLLQNPDEVAHMFAVLDLIDKGVTAANDLSSKLTEFYKRFQNEESEWSADVVNVMRAGVMSRLYELGMIGKVKQGLNVRYKLTTAGNDLKIKLQNVKEVVPHAN